MSGDDDAFEPRLGRMRAKGSKRGGKYLAQVLAATRLAGGGKGVLGRRFDGSRIGRGASIGRILGSRDRHAGVRTRRAVIKTRIVKLGGSGLRAARAHLRYIQRDGVTREGAPGQLYSAVDDVANGKAFLERSDGDRHQFRFIVSAEDGAEYPDLKPFVRRLMAQMETDLGTRLDWVAVDHFNTAHPHSHIMLRGKDDRDQNLVIAREYIGRGMRERASELVTLDLGPRTDLEIEARLRQDIGAERLTAIDRRLLRDIAADHIVTAADRDPFQQALRAGRLNKLGSLGLAHEIEPGQWRLADGIDETLLRMGERGDIIRTMQRDLAARDLERSAVDQVVHDSAAPITSPIIGRLVNRGLADEVADRHYLIVDGVDGRSHYIDIGKGDAIDPIPDDAIVRVAPRGSGVREADRTIAEIAAINGGRYDVDIHLRHDPNASETFAEAHIRRLEAMRRLMRSVERQPDGTWIIAPDHLDRAAAFEARQARDRPVTVETLSAIPLGRLARAEGATWLDREALARAPEPLRDGGFGREVRGAQAQRRQWLIAEGLAEERAGRISYRAHMLAILQRRELLRVADQLSGEPGLKFAEVKAGEQVEGTVRRRVDLVSGRFALVERSRDFVLVPWRPVLERRIGKEVAGIMRGDGISWTIGRGRGGPSIS